MPGAQHAPGRDRNWFDNDQRKNGGVAMYVRSNLKVTDVIRSDLYESISIIVTLPSGHKMLICTTYHPPKPKYKDVELIHYLSDQIDLFLDHNPNCVVICGGDFNGLDVNLLSTITGLNILVDFATRRNAILDNCLTNRPELFSKCYAINMLIKTDHKGIILPAGKKLKPLRYKYALRDKREHCKLAFQQQLNTFDWKSLLDETSTVDNSVNQLQHTIIMIMNQCFPMKNVSMSSRDPYWMTPLLKVLLKKRAKYQRQGKTADVELLNNRLFAMIKKNRRNIGPGGIGSGKWWKEIDRMSNRNQVFQATLDQNFVNKLNNYFADICTDDNYNAPIPMKVDKDTPVPELNETQVLLALSKVKKTATGPDNIPYWIWKDYANVFASLIKEIWNLSLQKATWPSSWKEANINPLAKIDVPAICPDFRGINVTTVIARIFERIVYQKFFKEDVENNMSKSQFAYRSGGSCEDALIGMQHFTLEALDRNDTSAVRLFSLDFSKAFDSVKHDILIDKLKNWPNINPIIVNWYLSFLENRKQRVIYQGITCEWKNINKGIIQGTVSGPYLFNIFMNDLESINYQSSLSKYADDSNLQIIVSKDTTDISNTAVTHFMDWSDINSMTCNPTKCKELIFSKKGQSVSFNMISNIAQHDTIKILGITFQTNSKFAKHVAIKLKEANKCLFVIRSLRKEGCTQKEIDHLFLSLILPKLTYGLSIYGASTSDLATVQCFLKRCHKRKYSSQLYSIYDLLEKRDRRIFYKIKSQSQHPLRSLLPRVKDSSLKLRNPTCTRPNIRTERFKNIYVNRLIFKYNLFLF